jgi:hypothetical protein
VGRALLTKDSEAILVSTWDGQADDVVDKDFGRASMRRNDVFTAALIKLDGFGRRGEPQLFEQVLESVAVSLVRRFFEEVWNDNDAQLAI